jgi:DNA-binding response OmpR family regulator
MTERGRLQAALIALAAEDALIVEAQAEVERYLAKEFEAAELVNRIILLFDGPDQRRAQQLAREALTEG